MKSLKSAGFSVHKPTKTKDGYVKVRAKKPSGNKAFCRINLEGKFEYKFDSYKGMSCLKDINSFETDLEDIYGFKLSDKRVLLKALEGAIYVKYSDRAERELMIKSACDTFPAQKGDY